MSTDTLSDRIKRYEAASTCTLVPREDAPNAFFWRQRDWERNSLQILARSHFPRCELAGRNHSEIHEMLHGAGVSWARLGPQLMHGTSILPGGELRSERVDYEAVNAWISSVGGPDRDEHRPSTTRQDEEPRQ